MEKTKEFINKLSNDKVYLKRVIIGLLSLSLLLITITFSLRLTIEYGNRSIWRTPLLEDGMIGDLFSSFSNFFLLIANILKLVYYVIVVVFLISLIKLFKGETGKTKIILVNAILNISIISLMFFINLFAKLFNSGLWFILITNTLINIILIIAYKSYVNRFAIGNNNAFILDNQNHRLIRIASIVVDVIGMIISFLVLVTPVFFYEDSPLIVLNIIKNGNPLISLYISSIVVFILYFFSSMYFILTVASFFINKDDYLKKSRNLNIYNTLLTFGYFFLGLVYTFLYRILNNDVRTLSYIPLMLMIIVYISNVYIRTKVGLITNSQSKDIKKVGSRLKVSPLIFTLIFTIITFSSLFFNIITINYKITGIGNIEETIRFSGIELLQDYPSLNEIFQAIAFIYVIILISSGVLLVLSLVNYIAKTNNYYKMTKATIYTNMFFAFIFAVIGIFFVFNQKYVDINIKSLLAHFGIVNPDVYTYSISSHTYAIFIIALIVLIILIFTKQLNIDYETKVLPSDFASSTQEQKVVTALEKESIEEEFDPCPAFTDLDLKLPEFADRLKYKQSNVFVNPTLPELVNFIVSYAGSSRLRLSYTYDDIATFIAGLGISRLTILQGMSGTGKTSLPKIFTEAIMGNCEIVEVESSWRDKNELLGYYNEFSRRYTPKKFTQSLYKAKLNPTIPTFIVLDELNLSRIEYYFSDFLSIMEAEEHKREIKLLNIKLYPQGFNSNTEYMGLKDGNTIEIPTNIWFIGTANRDESTFEISDKVYDRAHTMNFNKRAPKVRIYKEEMKPRYIPYDVLNQLFQDSKQKIEYDAESDVILQEVEKLLAPFNISFGNRILNQIEDFVKIYYECYSTSNLDKKEIIKNGVENIIFSKVVSKLEFKQIDNKEKLASSFDKLQLFKCSGFIRKLNGD